MRVLMVTALPPAKRYGGSEKFCRDLSIKLAERGFSIRILTSGPLDPSDHIDSNIEISDRLTRTGNIFARKLVFDYFNPENRKLFEEEVKEFRPNVVHFHGIYGVGSDLVDISSRITPTLVTVHDHWPFCFRSIAYSKGESCDLRCSGCRFPLATLTRMIKKQHIMRSILIAPSEYMANNLIRAGFINVRQIFNGVDLPFNLSPKAVKRVLFVGRMVPEKGPDLICHACSKAGVKLDLVGSGPMLKDLKMKYAKYPNISFKGYIDDIQSEYRKGGVVAVPSTCPDNLPTVPLEAMSFGLPVVGSRMGGIPEIIIDGVNGCLFDSGDIEQIIDALKYIMENDRILSMGRNAIEIVSRKFNWSRIVDQYINEYEKNQ